MNSVVFHPDVVLEIKSSYEFYKFKSAGLGEDFINELESAFEVIIDMPLAWPVIKSSCFFLLPKFRIDQFSK